MIDNQNYVALIISLLIGAGMPALVGLVTHQKIPSWVKAVLLLAFTTITGLLTQWLNAITTNVHFAWQAAVLTAIATYVTAVASHFGFLIPTGVTAFVAGKGITTDPEPVKPEIRILGTHPVAGMIFESPAYQAQEAAKLAGNAMPMTASSDWNQPPTSDVSPYIKSDITDQTRSPQVNAEASESLPGHLGTPRHLAARVDPADRPKRT